MWIDDVLKDVVHRDDVIFSYMIGQVGRLERALENVVSPGPPPCGYVRLDLDPRTFQIEEATELVEMPTVTGPDVKDAAWPIPDQPAVEAALDRALNSTSSRAMPPWFSL